MTHVVGVISSIIFDIVGGVLLPIATNFDKIQVVWIPFDLARFIVLLEIITIMSHEDHCQYLEYFVIEIVCFLMLHPHQAENIFIGPSLVLCTISYTTVTSELSISNYTDF